MIALVLAVLALGGAWLWLRDSPLVSVHKVTITGVSGPDAAQIRSALVASGKSMTTLDVQMGHLRTAVAPFPVVKALHVSTDFPHGLRIAVVEQVPVAVVVAPGRRINVSADGTLLHDATASSPLPAIDVSVAPGGTHLTGPPRQQVQLLAAAPYQLLAKISQVSDSASHGLIAQLRNGPVIYFGAAGRLGAKWNAAAQVLADGGSDAAAYVDVTDPARPAAGGGTQSSAGAAQDGTTSSTAAGSSSTAATPSGG
ncbi:MAG: cell division protein FtsQ/DivIB [Solirubrobacteraceae bacterium]